MSTPTQTFGMTNLKASTPAYITLATKTIANSELAKNLTQEQIAQLVQLSRPRLYTDGDLICDEYEVSDEMYVVAQGIVEAWLDPSTQGDYTSSLRRLGEMSPGQICGEIAMLDGGTRSAQLRAGPNGTTLLAFARTSFFNLCTSDAQLGFLLMRNLATALAHRMRLRRGF